MGGGAKGDSAVSIIIIISLFNAIRYDKQGPLWKYEEEGVRGPVAIRRVLLGMSRGMNKGIDKWKVNFVKW